MQSFRERCGFHSNQQNYQPPSQDSSRLENYRNQSQPALNCERQRMLAKEYYNQQSFQGYENSAVDKYHRGNKQLPGQQLQARPTFPTYGVQENSAYPAQYSAEESLQNWGAAQQPLAGGVAKYDENLMKKAAVPADSRQYQEQAAQLPFQAHPLHLPQQQTAVSYPKLQRQKIQGDVSTFSQTTHFTQHSQSFPPSSTYSAVQGHPVHTYKSCSAPSTQHQERPLASANMASGQRVQSLHGYQSSRIGYEQQQSLQGRHHSQETLHYQNISKYQHYNQPSQTYCQSDTQVRTPEQYYQTFSPTSSHSPARSVGRSPSYSSTPSPLMPNLENFQYNQQPLNTGAFPAAITDHSHFMPLLNPSPTDTSSPDHQSGNCKNLQKDKLLSDLSLQSLTALTSQVENINNTVQQLLLSKSGIPQKKAIKNPPRTPEMLKGQHCSPENSTYSLDQMGTPLSEPLGTPQSVHNEAQDNEYLSGSEDPLERGYLYGDPSRSPARANHNKMKPESLSTCSVTSPDNMSIKSDDSFQSINATLPLESFAKYVSNDGECPRLLVNALSQDELSSEIIALQDAINSEKTDKDWETKLRTCNVRSPRPDVGERFKMSEPCMKNSRKEIHASNASKDPAKSTFHLENNRTCLDPVVKGAWSSPEEPGALDETLKLDKAPARNHCSDFNEEAFQNVQAEYSAAKTKNIHAIASNLAYSAKNSLPAATSSATYNCYSNTTVNSISSKNADTFGWLDKSIHESCLRWKELEMSLNPSELENGLFQSKLLGSYKEKKNPCHLAFQNEEPSGGNESGDVLHKEEAMSYLESNKADHERWLENASNCCADAEFQDISMMGSPDLKVSDLEQEEYSPLCDISSPERKSAMDDAASLKSMEKALRASAEEAPGSPVGDMTAVDSGPPSHLNSQSVLLLGPAIGAESKVKNWFGTSLPHLKDEEEINGSEGTDKENLIVESQATPAEERNSQIVPESTLKMKMEALSQSKSPNRGRTHSSGLEGDDSREPLPDLSENVVASVTDQSLDSCGQTEVVEGIAHIQDTVESVAGTVRIQVPMKSAAETTLTQTPAKSVAHAMHTQTPTESVAHATHIQTPTKSVAHATHIQTPTKSVAHATHIQTPAEGVNQTTHFQTPTKSVDQTRRFQTPTKSVNDTPHIQAPTEDMSQTPHIQTPTEDVSQTRPIKASIESVDKNTHIPAPTEDMSQTPHIQTAPEDVSQIRPSKASIEVVDKTTHIPAPPEDMSQTSHIQAPIENVSQTSHIQAPTEEVSQTRHNQAPTEDVFQTTHIHVLTEGVSQTRHNLAPTEDVSQTRHNLAPTEDVSQTMHSQAPTEDVSQTRKSQAPTEDVSQTRHIQASTEDVCQTRHIQAPTEDVSQTRHIKAPTEDVSQTRHIQAPTEDVSQTKRIQAPTEDVSQTTHIQASTEDVSQTTHIQTPGEGVSQSINIQAPKEDMSQTRHIQAPTEDVSQSINIQAPKEDVSQTTNIQAPKEDMSQTRHIKAPVEGVDRTAHFQGPTEDVSQTAHIQAATEDVSQTGTFQAATEDVSQTGTFQAATEDVSQTGTFQAATEDVSQTGTFQAATEDVSQTGTFQAATEDVSQTVPIETSTEEVDQTAHIPAPIEDVSQTAHIQPATEEVSQTGHSQAPMLPAEGPPVRMCTRSLTAMAEPRVGGPRQGKLARRAYGLKRRAAFDTEIRATKILPDAVQTSADPDAVLVPTLLPIIESTDETVKDVDAQIMPVKSQRSMILRSRTKTQELYHMKRRREKRATDARLKNSKATKNSELPSPALKLAPGSAQKVERASKRLKLPKPGMAGKGTECGLHSLKRKSTLISPLPAKKRNLILRRSSSNCGTKGEKQEAPPSLIRKGPVVKAEKSQLYAHTSCQVVLKNAAPKGAPDGCIKISSSAAFQGPLKTKVLPPRKGRGLKLEAIVQKITSPHVKKLACPAPATADNPFHISPSDRERALGKASVATAAAVGEAGRPLKGQDSAHRPLAAAEQLCRNSSRPLKGKLTNGKRLPPDCWEGEACSSPEASSSMGIRSMATQSLGLGPGKRGRKGRPATAGLGLGPSPQEKPACPSPAARLSPRDKAQADKMGRQPRSEDQEVAAEGKLSQNRAQKRASHATFNGYSKRQRKGLSPSKAKSKAKSRKSRAKRRQNHAPIVAPTEPEIKLKYLSCKPLQRVESRAKPFAPYVQVERKDAYNTICTVINMPGDASNAQQDLCSALTGTPSARDSRRASLPCSSVMQLGPVVSKALNVTCLVCCLCRNPSNHRDLGDLCGPYYPEDCLPKKKSRLKEKILKTEQLVEGPSPSPPNDRTPRAADGNCGISPAAGKLPELDVAAADSAKQTLRSSTRGLFRKLQSCYCCDGRAEGEEAEKSRRHHCSKASPGSPSQESAAETQEHWVHEACAIWTSGVYLVGGKLYGLQEATDMAAKVVCPGCQQAGASISCCHKGCAQTYHFTCANDTGCLLNEDNFSLRCLKHKRQFL